MNFTFSRAFGASVELEALDDSLAAFAVGEDSAAASTVGEDDLSLAGALRSRADVLRFEADVLSDFVAVADGSARELVDAIFLFRVVVGASVGSSAAGSASKPLLDERRLLVG